MSACIVRQNRIAVVRQRGPRVEQKRQQQGTSQKALEMTGFLCTVSEKTFICVLAVTLRERG